MHQNCDAGRDAVFQVEAVPGEPADASFMAGIWRPLPAGSAFSNGLLQGPACLFG